MNPLHVVAAIGAAVLGYVAIQRWSSSSATGVSNARTETWAEGYTNWASGPSAPGNTTPAPPPPLSLPTLAGQAWSMLTGATSSTYQPPIGSPVLPSQGVNLRLSI